MKKNYLFSAFILFFFILSSLFAVEIGNIAGKITSKKTGRPLENAQIFLEDNTTGTYSKENGSFYLKNVPVGEHSVYISFIGYKQQMKTIIVEVNTTAMVNFSLISMAIEISGFDVTANRAKTRETPIAFTNINNKTISEKYTTGDMPQLLENVPGLFSSNSGLGEAFITMRGFDADKIQILVNGIPVNDPESQIVYWSNWTGLSSNVKSVQVQRGAGASLYGSGSFGGSVNIETIGVSKEREFTFRTSGGYYKTSGKVADGIGGMEEYHPMNYNTLVRYDSGDLFTGKFNFSLSAEKKYGDSYINGTKYDGYSLGFETESNLPRHKINTSLIFAPQKHLQARTNSDIELGKHLGREFNPTNHLWQENKYSKPQFSIRHKWQTTNNSHLMSNLFLTQGKGYGSFLNNGLFDIETGEIYYKNLLTASSEAKRYGRHAEYFYELTGEILEGYNPESDYYSYITYDGSLDSVRVTGADINIVTDDASHSWRNFSNNEHKQFGLNSYYSYDFNKSMNFIFGGEMRRWYADHYAESRDFRYADLSQEPDSLGNYPLGVYENTQRRYDYSAVVTNLSGFVRAQIKPDDNMNLMFDCQYAKYHSEVDENPIKVFNFGTGELTDITYFQTRDMMETVYNEEDSTWVEQKKFTADHYQRTYSFLSPKFGVNYNFTENFNYLANYSIAYKEPRTSDWYDRSDGPGVNQEMLIEGEIKQVELKPEKAETVEFGVGYEHPNISAGVNYYLTNYLDKIESITDALGDTRTINAGKAVHEGVELSGNFKYNQIDGKASATFSKNRWKDMNYDRIFYEDASEVIGKVVLYSPEKMINSDLGYSFYGLPLDGELRLGLNAKWWDDYYTTYTNKYIKEIYGYDDNGDFYSDGEHGFFINPDGEGDYNYVNGEYVYVGSGGEYDKEYIESEAKLPYFFELNSSISYSFHLGNKPASIRINLNNILNRKDNYSRAYIGKLYGRSLDGTETDPTYDAYYPYVAPSPLFNVFITVEVKI